MATLPFSTEGSEIPPLESRSMSFSAEQVAVLVDQLDLLGDHLAELHERIDPDDEASMASLIGAMGHYNALAVIIDPESKLDIPIT